MSPISGATCRIEQSALEIRVQWWASDTAAFERVRASFRATFPPPGARWDRHQRHWTLPPGEWGRLRSWVAATFLPEAATWATSARPGRGSRAGGASWGAWDGRISTERRAELERLAAAYAVLALTPGAPPALVEAARRVLAKTAHPDAGGTEEQMAAINAAADKILKERGAAV